MARWLELTADFRCNNRCTGCFAVQDDGASMSSREVLAALQLGRREGADGLWLGGGEPTLRRDLLATVRAARAMGYAKVKLQTNGMLLAYSDFTTRMRDAGVTEVALSLKGASAATHDALAQTPGCWELLHQGLAHARALGLGLEGDVLLYSRNVGEVAALVRHFHAQGLARFRFWMFSTADQGTTDLRALVPRASDVVAALREARALELSSQPDFLVSLHTPPCTIPAAHAPLRFFAPELGLLVANPGGHSFMLETSPIEGGNYLPGCASCALRPRCGGVRADYLAIHGPSEFVPVPTE